MIRIERLSALHPGVEPLRRMAEQEGFRFLSRLVTAWRSGSVRFDRPGEALVGAFRAGALVGIGDLSRDPYVQDRTGRLRHLYVTAASRRIGVASDMVRHLLETADGTFDLVRLQTDTAGAAAFYERIGFVAFQDATASHVTWT